MFIQTETGPFPSSFPQIRLKRIAKLQAASSPAAPESTTPPPKPTPKPIPAPSPKATLVHPTPGPALLPQKKKPIAKLDLLTWEHESVGYVFKATLDVCLLPYRLASSDSTCFRDQ